MPGVHGQGYVEMPGAEDLDCLAGGCADGRKVGTGEFLAVVQRWMREADLMGRLRLGGYAFTVPALRSGGKGARWVRRSGCRGMGRVTSRCWERRIYTVRGASVMDARSRPDGSASVSMRLQLQRFDQAGKARVGFEEVVAGAWAGLRRGAGNGGFASSRGASVMDA